MMTVSLRIMAGSVLLQLAATSAVMLNSTVCAATCARLFVLLLKKMCALKTELMLKIQKGETSRCLLLSVFQKCSRRREQPAQKVLEGFLEITKLT